MDTITMGAVLVAVVTDASEALSGQLRAGVDALVRRPFRPKATAGGETATVTSGEAELLALQQSPHDQQKAAV